MDLIRIRYIGTGEAFDHRLINTSLVYEGKKRILIDCGYAVPHALWQHSLDPHWLDGIYVSHFHADHCFGLPAVLARMSQDGRTQSLTLFGGKGSRQSYQNVLDCGYPNLRRKSSFEIQFVEVHPSSPVTFGSMILTSAVSNHSITNHSIRLAEGSFSVCYSGDGGPTEETEELFIDASLLIHEAYYPEISTKSSHASVPQVVAMAKRIGVKQLHLVHLKRSATPPQGVEVPLAGSIYSLSPEGCTRKP